MRVPVWDNASPCGRAEELAGLVTDATVLTGQTWTVCPECLARAMLMHWVVFADTSELTRDEIHAIITQALEMSEMAEQALAMEEESTHDTEGEA